MHPWSNVELRPGQRAAFDEVELLLARERVLTPICLVGAFGVGKTTLARYWLSRHFEAPEACYISAGRALLEDLKREDDLNRLAENDGKTRLILQLSLNEIMERGFSERDALVIDGLDVALPYRLPLPMFAQPHTQSGKIAVFCLAEDEASGFRFEFPRVECHWIEIGK